MGFRKREFRYRKCLKCFKIYQQQQGTLAITKKSYNKCPYCGGKTILDDELEKKRKLKIGQRKQDLLNRLKN